MAPNAPRNDACLVDDGAGFLEQFARMHDAPEFYPLRYRPGDLGNWSGHLPFANDLIRAARPRVVVELGAHYGESYFGFCQSVAQNGTGSLCYAVDHWRGDEHAGKIGDEVYQEVSAYNQHRYGGFSHLLRCSFDEALSKFEDASIDLLHIDGLHTYEAAAHDFESWLPKVAPGGIVLLHDIAVRHVNFGVWKLWERIRQQYEETFEFHHSWGLGVVRKPGRPLPDAGLPRLLFGKGADPAVVRRYYVLLATSLEYAAEQEGRREGPRNPEAVQIFPFGSGGYRESTSYIEHVPLDRRQEVRAAFDGGLGNGPLRIDFCSGRGAARIWRAAILDTGTGRPLWAAEDPEALVALRTAGQVAVLPVAESAIFVSSGADPQIFIEDIPEAARSAPVTVELSLVIAADLKPLWETIQTTMAGLRDAARADRGRRIAIEESLSWKMSKPLRFLASIFIK